MAIATTSIVSGCGDAPDDLPRQTVQGTVKWNGEPMKTGVIQFQPSSPGSATAGGSGITEGSYSIPKAQGLVPGTYRVSITSVSAVAQPAGALPGDSLPPAKERIPPRYNAQTQLTAEVKDAGPNQFDFDLQPK